MNAIRRGARSVAWMVLFVLPLQLWAAAAQRGGPLSHVHEPQASAVGHAYPNGAAEPGRRESLDRARHDVRHASATKHAHEHGPRVTHRHEVGLAGVVFVAADPADETTAKPERRSPLVPFDMVPAVPWRSSTASCDERPGERASPCYRSWIPTPLERPPR